jgi:hypothetical protein
MTIETSMMKLAVKINQIEYMTQAKSSRLGTALPNQRELQRELQRKSLEME